jgi:MarR family transcriptional regulator, organic hydroperoxide resistance regulator
MSASFRDMEPTAQEQAWRCILDLFMAQRGRLIGVAHELGLAPQQALAIKHLDPDRGLTMSELAQRLHCDNSNVTGIADRLEAAGLAERRPHPGDRRVKTLVLTDRGTTLRGAYNARLGRVPPELRALSDDDAEQLLEIMRRATQADAEPDRHTSPTV